MQNEGRGAGREWIFRLLRGRMLMLAVACLPAIAHAQALVALKEDPHRPGGEWVAASAVAPGPVLASVSGTVQDASEAAVPDAVITMQGGEGSGVLRAQSGPDGEFVLQGMPAGSYRIAVERDGFAGWSGVATVTSGQQLALGRIALPLAVTRAAVEVRASGYDVAAAQLELEEHQRVLGVFPNFYAAYTPDTEPLSPGQKMHLAVRFAGDPVAFAMAGVVAGSEQRANAFSGYGQGTSGYLKRYGAAYTDGLTSTLLGQAVFPVLLHQDPRFFVKESGSAGARALYAVASMVICKGDNRRWQLNYSNLLGNLASAGISNAYYPSAQRGASLVLSNALTATALGAVGGLFQEFLLHRMTPGVPEYGTR